MGGGGTVRFSKLGLGLLHSGLSVFPVEVSCIFTDLSSFGNPVPVFFGLRFHCNVYLVFFPRAWLSVLTYISDHLLFP